MYIIRLKKRICDMNLKKAVAQSKCNSLKYLVIFYFLINNRNSATKIMTIMNAIPIIIASPYFKMPSAMIRAKIRQAVHSTKPDIEPSLSAPNFRFFEILTYDLKWSIIHQITTAGLVYFFN